MSHGGRRCKRDCRGGGLAGLQPGAYEPTYRGSRIPAPIGARGMFHVKRRSRNTRPLLNRQAGIRWRTGSCALRSCQRLPGHLQCPLMLSMDNVRELLAPFKIPISDQSIESLIVYLDLLLCWNRKINLTSISTPEECVTRHFGESFLVSRKVQLSGRLLDIGSGAGFPGLALKLIAPQLEVVLLEPVAKKRAFLKEVARACNMDHIQVVGSRLDEFVRSEGEQTFDIITVRAVGGLTSLVPQARGLLRHQGRLCLWLGAQQVREIHGRDAGIEWSEPEAIPLSNDRVLLVGNRAVSSSS